MLMAWKYIWITPVQISRFVFCLMLAIFDFDYNSFFNAWKETR